MVVLAMPGAPIIDADVSPALWALSPAALLAAALATSVFRKATGSPASGHLRDELGVAPRLWSTIGALESFATLGLVVGLARPVVGVAAASGSGLLMLGAILAHLRVGLGGRRLVAPSVLLAVAVAAGLGFSAVL